MRIIGGTINTSIYGVEETVVNRDRDRLLRLARYQLDSGAETIAVNAGTLIDSEVDDIVWMVTEIQKEIEIPLFIDTPNKFAMEAGLRVHRHGRPIIDATTAEQVRMNDYFALAKEYDAEIVGLLHDEQGIPISSDMDTRLYCAEKIIEKAKEYNVKMEDLYVDPLCTPVSISDTNGINLLRSLKVLKEEFPFLKTSIGLNNISYGMPNRELINQAFVSMCCGAGIDQVLLEITGVAAANMAAMRTLQGKDAFSTEYLRGYRAGTLDIYRDSAYEVE